MSQSVMLSGLPRDAKSALEGVDVGQGKKGERNFSFLAFMNEVLGSLVAREIAYWKIAEVVSVCK
jgi:hypothetical protein